MPPIYSTYGACQPFWALLLVFLAIFILLAVQFLRFVNMRPTLLLNLEGTWQYTVGPDPDPSTSNVIRLPGDLPRRERRSFRHWVTYERKFTPPSACFEQQCALIIGEFGDGLRVFLNHNLIGVRGKIENQGRYEHHYAVDVEIPPTALNYGENYLTLEAYSPKFELTGPRRPPLGIVSSDDGRAYVRAKAFHTVFLKVGSAGILALLGAITFGAKFFGYLKSPLSSYYVRCSIAASLFLLSFSEIPREYLSLGFAISLHCVLRYAMDWSNFSFAARALAAPRTIRAEPKRINQMDPRACCTAIRALPSSTNPR